MGVPRGVFMNLRDLFWICEAKTGSNRRTISETAAILKGNHHDKYLVRIISMRTRITRPIQKFQNFKISEESWNPSDFSLNPNIIILAERVHYSKINNVRSDKIHKIHFKFTISEIKCIKFIFSPAMFLWICETTKTGFADSKEVSQIHKNIVWENIISWISSYNKLFTKCKIYFSFTGSWICGRS